MKAFSLPDARAPQRSLLQMADFMGREQDAFAQDLANRLFPQSTVFVTDRDVAEVRRCLSDWVRAIECALSPDLAQNDDLFPLSWDTLAASSLLTDARLLQEARARGFLWHFSQGNAQVDAQVQIFAHGAVPIAVARMAALDDPLTADAAMKLTSATLRDNCHPPGQLVELPVEVLHLLAWRVVAAHEILQPGRQQDMQSNVAVMLSRHDEGLSLSRSAQHLAHKMMELHLVDPTRPALQPSQQGLPLSLALLALASGLPFMVLVQFAMETGLPRLATVLRAMDYDDEQAGAVMGWIVGRRGQDHAALNSLFHYYDVRVDAAVSLLNQWRDVAAREAVL